MSLIESNKLKPLIVLQRRDWSLPNVPTAKELGTTYYREWRCPAVKKGTVSKDHPLPCRGFQKCTGRLFYKTIAHAKPPESSSPGWEGPEEYGKFWTRSYARYQ